MKPESFPDSPAEHEGAGGFDAGIMAAAEADIRENMPLLYSILVICRGKQVYEAYFQDDAYPEFAVNIKSVSKVILSAAVGMMIRDNLISGVMEPVAGLLPEYAGCMQGEGKKEMLLKHLLTMSSGLKWQEGGNSYPSWVKSRDWVLHALSLPLDHEPGKVFNYNTANSHLVSAAIRRRTGLPAYSYIRERIFTPLGIRQAMWQVSPEGNDFGGSELYLSPRDIGRIGCWLLNEGRWLGRSLLPEGWVRECLKPHIWVNRDTSYGYFWFGTREKAAAGRDGTLTADTWCVPGTGGQFMYIVPGLDIVAVVTSLTRPHDGMNPFDLPAAGLFRKYIFQALYSEKEA